MSIEEKIGMHKALLESLHNLYVAKNRDYGDSVHDTYEDNFHMCTLRDVCFFITKKR